MSKKPNDNETKKRKHITLAKTAFFFAVIAIFCPTVLFVCDDELTIVLLGVWWPSSGAAIALGLVSLLGRHKQISKTDKALAIFSIVAPTIMTTIVIILLFLPNFRIYEIFTMSQHPELFVGRT